MRDAVRQTRILTLRHAPRGHARISKTLLNGIVSLTRSLLVSRQPSRSDFVARNETFVELGDEIAAHLIGGNFNADKGVTGSNVCPRARACACSMFLVLWLSGNVIYFRFLGGCYFLPFLFPSSSSPPPPTYTRQLQKTLIALILQLTYKHTCIPAHLLCARGQVVFQSCNVDPASLAAEVVASGDNIGSMIGGIVAQIGENIQLQRACTLELTAPGVLGRCVPTLS